MAEFRRPGVFVKEVPSIPPPPPAAPSALGIIGFTLKGPSNKAIRVESFDDFSETFGGYTPLSLVPLELEKYFNNGGQVAYVVRVTPVGSQKAENRFIGDAVYANGLAAGDGVKTLFSGIIPNAPLARGRLVVSVQGTGVAGPYTFTIPGGPFVPHSIGIIAGSQRVVDNPTGYPVGEFVGNVASGTINYETGAVSITFSGVVAANVTILVYITAVQIRSIDSTGLDLIAFDDGTGHFSGDVGIGANSIDYLTGEFNITFSSAPNGSSLVMLSNDVFGSVGNVAISETVLDPTFVVTGMSDGSTYQPAVGSIRAIAGALLVDGETFTIGDGVNPPVVFEFDSGGGVSPGNVPVPFTAGDTDVMVANSIRAAINTVPKFNVSADPIFAFATRSRFLITAQSEGESGNDILMEIQGAPTFRKQERSGEFAASTLLAQGNGSAGPYTFKIPGAPLLPNSITITAGEKFATDDGRSTLVGNVVSGSTVDYTDGAVSITFDGAIAVGVPIRVTQSGFQYFDVVVSEYQQGTQEFLTKEVFEAVDLANSSSSEFIATVVNDVMGGSSYINIVAGQIGVLPSLIRTTHIQTIGTGDGVLRRFQATLEHLPVDPFSVKVTVTTPFQETLDDGVGFLGGPYADPFGVNQINYTDGTIDVTFKQPPGVGAAVKVIYTQQRVVDSVRLLGGTNGTGVISSSQIADSSLEASKSGVFAFNLVEAPLNIIVPDFAESYLVLQDLIAYAEAKKDRFIIGTTAMNLTPHEAVNYRRRDIRSNSSYVAIYYPWLRSIDRSTGKVRTIPPLGHVAGVYSRVDRTRSEGKAPAGITDGLLLDAVGLERILEPQDVDLLYPVHIDTIVQAAAIGIYLNGARTLSTDTNFKYINVRRVFIAIRKRAENDLRFALFEPIGPALFSRISATLTNIGLEYFQKGALVGTNPREAFEVVVDELNTPELANQGIVKARLAIAPTKPAEFIVVELTVKQKENTILLS